MGVFITKDLLTKIKEEYETNKLYKKETTQKNDNSNSEKTINNDYIENVNHYS